MEATLYHYVYRTTCSVNGKWYIGIRSCRCWPTRDAYLGSGVALQAAIRKYGGKAFKKAVLVVVQTRDEALRIEAALVTEDTVLDRSSYNRTRGGGSGPLTHRMTLAGKRKHRQRMSDPDWKRYMLQFNLGNQRRLGKTGSERQRLAVVASNKRRAG